MTWTRRSNRCFEVEDREAKKQRGRRRRTKCFYRSDAEGASERTYCKELTQRTSEKDGEFTEKCGSDETLRTRCLLHCGYREKRIIRGDRFHVYDGRARISAEERGGV